MSSRHCQLTGREPGFGKQVSHSNRHEQRAATVSGPRQLPRDAGVSESNW